MTDFGFPFRIGRDGRTASPSRDRHIRDLIEQVLFTAPGERVNRPEFGSDLMRLVFAPNGEALAQAVQATVRGALQRWLGDLIQVDDVEVQSVESELRVTVRYAIRPAREARSATFAVPLP